MKLKSLVALSLIEFLLAMMIFSTIAVSIYATFFNGIQISRKAKNFESFHRNIRFTLQAMQDDLENMVPFQFNIQDPPVLAFSGNTTSFQLIVPSESGIKKIRYFIGQAKNTHVHTVQLGTHGDKSAPVTIEENLNQTTSSVLIRQEQAWTGQINDEILNKYILNNSLKISYASPDEENLIWTNQWNAPSFPAGIRVEMAFLDPTDPQNIVTINKIIHIPLGLKKKTSP